MQHAIYTITNIENGRQYFGMTKNVTSRWYLHVKHLSAGRHANKALQADFDKIGLTKFTFQIIEEFDSREEADAKETELIVLTPHCYNERKCPTATGTRSPWAKADLIAKVQALKGKLKGYEIAEKFGVSPSLISSIQTGNHPLCK